MSFDPIPYIRLFNALPIFEESKDALTFEQQKEIHKLTIEYGFLFDEKILNNYSYNKLREIAIDISSKIGLTKEQLNNTFWSWKKVATASSSELVFQQLIHYITTYGFKLFNVYSDDTIYIPTKNLQIPEISVDKIPFKLIRGFSKEELKEKAFNLLRSGIALQEKTLQDVFSILIRYDISELEINSIKNNEARIICFSFLHQIPSDPVDFLRLVVYTLTNSALLIKNQALISSLKSASENNLILEQLFVCYMLTHSLIPLAEIFHRYKPLFLALRKNQRLKPIINQISRIAKKHHKPLRQDLLLTLTYRLETSKNISINALKKALSNASIFRKIRLLNAIKYRMHNFTDFAYRIRNGKVFAKTIDKTFNVRLYRKVYDVILDSIVSEISPKLSGKKIFVPGFIDYKLPTSEKSFIGNFPIGTTFKLKTDLVAGIHWTNLDDNSYVDLDLSTMDLDGRKIGWDAEYRSGKILFSGDITSAPEPDGATELVYISKDLDSPLIISTNLYWAESDIIPFTFIIAKETASSITKNEFKNYLIDPNNLIATINLDIKKSARTIGNAVVSRENKSLQLTLLNLTFGYSRTLRRSGHLETLIKSTINSTKTLLSLYELLNKIDIIAVDRKEDADIDFSPENLTKETFIKLLEGDKI